MFQRFNMRKCSKIGLVTVAAALAMAACGGGTAGTPTPRSLGGGTQITGFTPTPTAGVRNATPSGPTPTGRAATATPAGAPAAAEVVISTAGNDLKFDKEKLSAKAGAEIKVTLKNGATSKALQHNWVLVKKGTVDAVGNAALAAGPANNWVPKGDPNVIAFLPLVDGGATGSGTIKVPQAGTYDYLCSFPGHPATMQGTFEATP